MQDERIGLQAGGRAPAFVATKVAPAAIAMTVTATTNFFMNELQKMHQEQLDTA